VKGTQKSLILLNRRPAQSSIFSGSRQGHAAFGGGCVPASGSENLEITVFLTEGALTENLERRPFMFEIGITR
jgi:hypothetical protein